MSKARPERSDSPFPSRWAVGDFLLRQEPEEDDEEEDDDREKEDEDEDEGDDGYSE